MLASDDENPQYLGAKNPDAALVVDFYLRPVQNMFETTKQNRPIFSDVIYVRIQIPGMKESIHDTPARMEHKQRFPVQWAFFDNKTKGDAREIGTRLDDWPVLTRSQAEEFRALKFYTVESIANAADANISNLGMVGGMSPYTLRERAKAFLKSAADGAFPQQLAEEVAKRDVEIAALKAQIEAIAAKVSAPTPPPAPKPAKKTLSPAHLAKLAAGRKAAADKRKSA